MMEDPYKWDKRFISLAQHVAQWSKDPSTKVGAVIVDPKTRIIKGVGYNGFPRGVADTRGRLSVKDVKYKMVVHAEANAILNSNSDVRGCKLYLWPLPPCSDCAKLIIQSGVNIIAYAVLKDDDSRKWADEFAISSEMFIEAGVYAYPVETHR